MKASAFGIQSLGAIKRFIPMTIVLVSGILSVIIFMMVAKRSDAVRHDFHQAQKELELYRTGVWHLEKLDLAKLERDLKSMETNFPSIENLGVSIGELSNLANRFRVTLASITPGEVVEVQSEKGHDILSVMSRVPVEIHLEGGYEDLGVFLSRLSSLEHGVIRTERFRLEKGEGGAASLKMTLSASVYMRKSPEQEILKEPIAQAPLLERLGGKSRFDDDKRDPFQKVVAAVVGKGNVVLEGIIYDPKQPLALINGEMKGIGDRVEGMRILEISPSAVVFEKEGERIEMRLRGE